MADKDEPLTFDALSAVYRKEKNSPMLSTVRKDFYTAAQELIAAQSKECDRLAMENPDSIVYEGATQRKKQILITLRSVVEFRMTKIASMATRGAMGTDNVLDDLTSEEKEYYEKVLEASKEMWKLSKRKTKTYVNQDITDIPEKKDETPVMTEPKRPVDDDIPLSEMPLDDGPEEMAPAEEIVEEEIEESVPVEEQLPVDIPAPAEPVHLPEEQETVVIRILEDLQPFSGPEVNYDLKKEDIVRMPTVMAQALINRGVARLVPTA